MGVWIDIHGLVYTGRPQREFSLFIDQMSDGEVCTAIHDDANEYQLEEGLHEAKGLCGRQEKNSAGGVAAT